GGRQGEQLRVLLRHVSQRPERAREWSVETVGAGDRRALHDLGRLEGWLVRGEAGGRGSPALASQRAADALSTGHPDDTDPATHRGAARRPRRADRVAGHPAEVVSLPQSGQRTRAEPLLAGLRALPGAA